MTDAAQRAEGRVGRCDAVGALVLTHERERAVPASRSVDGAGPVLDGFEVVRRDGQCTLDAADGATTAPASSTSRGASPGYAERVGPVAWGQDAAPCPRT